jgi:hypothetical protein
VKETRADLVSREQKIVKILHPAGSKVDSAQVLEVTLETSLLLGCMG